MEETKTWIENELPALGSDFIVSTSRQGMRSRASYGIERAVLVDCRLTIRSTIKDETGRTFTGAVAAMLKDVDVASVAPQHVPGLSGSTTDKPHTDVFIHLATGRPKSFVEYHDDGRPSEPTDIMTIHVRDQASGERVANAVRRAAILCGAATSPF